MSDPIAVLTANLMERDATIRKLREDLAEADRQLVAMAQQCATDRAAATQAEEVALSKDVLLEIVVEERDAARSEAAANALARDAARRDVELAAGELRIPLPAPGTDLARLLAANSILRRERDHYSQVAHDNGKARTLAEEEVERLKKYEPRLVEATIKPGEATARVKAPFAQDFALLLAELLCEHGAPNYIETKVTHPTYGLFAATIQRCTGKTPHEFRVSAEGLLYNLACAVLLFYRTGDWREHAQAWAKVTDDRPANTRTLGDMAREALASLGKEAP